MADEIKLKPGTIDDYQGSMAKAMEDAFKAIWPGIMGTEAPKTDKHLKMMFIAISQGIVKHLSDKVNALKISVRSQGYTSECLDTGHLHKHTIDKSDNISGSANWYDQLYNHTHPVSSTDTHDHITEVSIDTDDTLIS